MAGLHSLSEYELHIGSHVHCLFCWEGESHPRLRYRGLTGIERAGTCYQPAATVPNSNSEKHLR